jgi:hypothetical protein
MKAYFTQSGKIQIALLLFLSVFCSKSFATIIRVDNNAGNPSTYTTAQSAHDAASAGDTIYFSGSGSGYGNLTMTKKLFLFGPGFYLTYNPKTQANPNSAQLGTITINTGSSGSLITGLSTTTVYINTSNIILKRNYIQNCCGYTESVLVAGSLSNILILQNYIYNWHYADAMNISGSCTNIIIKNNYIQAYYSNGNSYRAVAASSSIDFGNNVISGNLNISNSVVYNNIQVNSSAYTQAYFYNVSSNTCNGNIGASTEFDTTGGNMQSVTMSSVFQGGTSPDGSYILKSGSPAIGYGVNGADAGMFGGNDPYVLSGLPAIPAIYFFTSSSTGSGPTGLPVRIKVKSHN